MGPQESDTTEDSVSTLWILKATLKLLLKRVLTTLRSFDSRPRDPFLFLSTMLAVLKTLGELWPYVRIVILHW